MFKSALILASPAVLSMANAAPDLRKSAADPWPLIWPLPQRYVNGSGARTFSQFSAEHPSGTEGWMQDVIAALDRFNATAFPYPAEGQQDALLEVQFHITNTSVSTTKQFGVDESYSMSVPESGPVVIKSETIFGFYYGLETLSQLVQYDGAAGNYGIKATPWTIVDAPRFPHRGNSIDTSRHYMQVPILKKVIDGLAYTKMNVFHWHMNDFPAFPYVSKKYPTLGATTALDPRLVYSPAMIREVVEYARQRGVRVMMELDTPGHNYAICKGLPEICPPFDCMNMAHRTHTLDPTQNKTYEVVIGLWQELHELFPDNWNHWGGDEISYECLQTLTHVQEFVKAHNVTGGVDGLETYYFERLGKMADTAFPTKKRVFWNDATEKNKTRIIKGPSGLMAHLNPENSILHLWVKMPAEFQNIWADHGFYMLYSPDGGPGEVYEDSNSLWQSYYMTEPCAHVNATVCEKFLGGEGAEWSEHIDASRLLSYVFPYASAYAERLWSPRDVVSKGGVEAAEPRIRWFRCLLNDRGIEAYATNVHPDRPIPADPISCYNQ